MRAFGLLLFSLTVQAFQTDRAEVPPPLRPWVDWVLAGEESDRCPTAFNDKGEQVCAWPSVLEVDVRADRGTFEQSWTVYAPQWVTLPGSTTVWPEAVEVDGRPVPVVTQGSAPGVRLTPGNHRITGRWRWTEPPRFVQIPLETGLVALRIDGREVAFPRRDAEGRLWVAMAQEGEEAEENRLVLRAFRLLVDDIPMRNRLLVELEVSGKAREVNLGNPLLAGFQPMRLTSDVPARLDEAGNLIVQVRAGRFSVNLISRAQAPVFDLTAPDLAAPWPAEELWSFEARPALRALVLTGFPQVDPSRTRLPSDWHQNPCYQALPGSVLRLEERARGLVSPPPDRLTLSRKLWLDFDGGGYTFQDTLSGALNRQWRLSMVPPFDLGRASMGGEPQLITVMGSDAPAGVETHVQNLELSAEGRINSGTATLSAGGWDVPFDGVRTEVNLSPGWSALAVQGPDTVDGDWLHSWSLWDFFWVLLLAVAVGKLWGTRAGVLALVTATLWHMEAGAPPPSWFLLLLCAALCRVAKGRAARGMAWLRGAVGVLLVLSTLPILHKQFLTVMYPRLSIHEYSTENDSEFGNFPAEVGFDDGSVADEMVVTEIQQDRAFQYNAAPEAEPQRELYQKSAAPRKQLPIYTNQYDLSLRGKVQTGPGIPVWRGTRVVLSWQGPLDPSVSLRLWLLPPWANRLLTVLRILGVIALLWVMVEVRKPGNLLGAPRHAAVLVAPLVFFCLASVSARAQDFPEKWMLDELRARLVEKPDCYPSCAEPVAATLRIDGDDVVLQMDMHSAARVAVPLPGQPYQVRNAGGTLPLHLKDGELWGMVDAGISRLTLRYRLGGKDRFPLRFRQVPHRLTAEHAGWEAAGLHEDGTCEEQIELRRLGGPTAPDGTAAAVPESFEPFLTVTRTAVLENTWIIDTEVRRNNGGAIVTDIPLLPGENVVTNARVTGGKVAVSLPEGTDTFRWRSTVDPRDTWTWTAPADVPWHEVWQLRPDRLWHVAWEGTPMISTFEDGGDALSLAWRPRAGESLDLTVVRPAALDGQTLTFHSVYLTVTPGKRQTACALSLKVRSSVGGEHGISLPPDAAVESYQIDGDTQPVRLEDGKLVLTLLPRETTQTVTWKSDQPLETVLAAVPVDLHHDLVNLTTRVGLPEGRWVLWVDGPGVGPGLLFWPMLLMVLCLSVVLGRAQNNDLKTHQWALLGLGLSQLHILSGLVAVAWFCALARRARVTRTDHWRFNVIQVGLLGLTLVFAVVLMTALRTGLVGQPNMYVIGNIYRHGMTWYVDRVAGVLPSVTVVSLPMWFYRVCMLGWALWLAVSVVAWARRAWETFSHPRLFDFGGTGRKQEAAGDTATPSAEADEDTLPGVDLSTVREPPPQAPPPRRHPLSKDPADRED